jgi:hypothetical protein
MSLNSFSPNTKIKSAEHNANWSNFSAHGRNVTMKWFFAGTLIVGNSLDYLSLPDNATIDRVDLVVNTVPTGAAIIVDIERSTDGGANWTTIFTGGTNRPQIAISGRTGNTTTIDVPAVTANSHLYRAKISQVGSTIAGADLAVMVRAKYNLD